MAMHRKLEVFLALRPDIAILSECASPDVKAMTPIYAAASSHAWTGNKRHKGLAALTFGPWRMTELPKPPSGGLVIPLHIDGPESFRLLAVWTQRPGYVEQAHKALDGLDSFLRGDDGLVIAGDLNSNTIWDHEHPRDASHSALTARLAAMGLFSAYHAHHGEAHGVESRATFYLYRHAERAFHLDYVFLPEAWRARIKSVEIGTYEAWSVWSDHVPVVIDTDS